MAAKPPRGESGDSPVEPKSYERLSTQLSVLLAEMVRTQDVAVANSWSPEVQPGGTVGRFKLVRELGRGGFGLVYEAVDGDLSRTVALKVVKPGTRLATRSDQWLMREAEAVARLNHPNIVTLHDFGKGPTGPYLVFEMLRGRTLAERLRGGPMPLDEVIDVGIAVTRALVHAHGAGVIHRDLTAANVHLAEDGAVKVLDFGLAHLFGRDGANDGGTPAYMAPEQWEGDQGDARTDLFALGVILYQALTGSFPYKVDKGWSEALEPGETPRVPRRLAPARLRRLVRSLLDREPELRPENARTVRDTLLGLRRSRDAVGRRRLLGGAMGVTAAAVAASAWLYLQHEAPPGEQVRVVMAGMENGAGDAPLDAVPGLLSTALEPSPRVKIVPQPRLVYLARQAGLGDPGRIDAERGKELARIAGAAVMLVPSSWKEDGKVALGVRAIESETGRTMFRVNAILHKPGDLAGTVDQLSDRIRRELNERAEDRRIRRPVAVMVTASPEAARYYYEGLDCVQRPQASGIIASAPCEEAFERALALDPTFPLAHYQLALLKFLLGDSGELARPHLQAALGASDRMPARESQLVRALAARVERHTDEALRIYDQLLAATPEDPTLLLATSDLYQERGDWAAAARFLQKLVAVEPDADDPMMSLVDALGRCGRGDEIKALLPRLQVEPRRARILVQANVWLGRRAEAVEVARRAVAQRGDEELDTLRYALAAAGEYVEAEQVARRETDRTPDAWRRVASALTAQGRLTEALRIDPGDSNLAQAPFREAMVETATWSAQRVWPHAAQAFAVDQRYSADLALVLLLLGDRAHAEQLAQALDPGSSAAVQYQALRKWRDGDAVGAAAMLARVENEDPWPAVGLAPAYLLAEILGLAGRRRGHAGGHRSLRAAARRSRLAGVGIPPRAAPGRHRARAARRSRARAPGHRSAPAPAGPRRSEGAVSEGSPLASSAAVAATQYPQRVPSCRGARRRDRYGHFCGQGREAPADRAHQEARQEAPQDRQEGAAQGGAPQDRQEAEVILAITHRRDEHARPVLDALARQGAEAVMLDLAELPRRGRVALSFGAAGGRRIRVDGRPPIDAERIDALWWRRPRPMRAPRRLGPIRAEFAVRQMLEAIMGVVASLEPGALLVNHPWRDDAAGQKTFQLAAAERLGLTIPATLVTSDPEAAGEFLRRQDGAGAIHKALRSTPRDWRRTCRVGARGLAGLPGLEQAPLILQQRIPGVDVRVTLVGEELFAAEIDARRSPSPDDYRGFERQCRIAPCRLPAEVERDLRALVRELGLVYGAADFRRRADGRWFFLELNPGGQWDFVEERTGQPITEAVAALLGRAHRGPRPSQRGARGRNAPGSRG